MYLNERELKVLHALAGGVWRNTVQLADDTHLHPQAVRWAIGELRARRYVRRAGWADGRRWGEFQITESGQRELVEHSQLRIVGVDNV